MYTRHKGCEFLINTMNEYIREEGSELVSMIGAMIEVDIAITVVCLVEM